MELLLIIVVLLLVFGAFRPYPYPYAGNLLWVVLVVILVLYLLPPLAPYRFARW
jgi:hypothetical protein